MDKIVVGAALAAIVGGAGYRKKALSPGGAVGATAIGTAIFAAGGWQWSILPIGFFVSASMLSFFKKTEKTQTAEKFEKGNRRDFWQTMANGGTATVAAVMAIFSPHPAWIAAFVGAIATATADTWATELGVLSRQLPRLITTGKPVSRGTSGGVTLLGTLAAMAGTLFIGGLAFGLHIGGKEWQTVAFGAAVGGIAGALADSVLGATVQVVYRCPRCGQKTEQWFHRACHGQRTEYLRGVTWVNNDTVNFFSTVAGAVVAAIFTFF